MKLTRVFLTCVVMLMAAPPLYAQGALDAARDLYASADYERALVMLDDLVARNDAAAQSHHEIDLYRALCLLALGKRDDADRAVETIVRRDPLYRPPDDIAPRMRTAFGDAKKRLLPAIVQQHYAAAKSAFDDKNYAVAAEGFQRVLDALNDPDFKHAASQPPLADLGTLASGFRDLSVKAIPPPPPPAAFVALPPPVAVAAVSRIYNGTEPGVIPPVAIVQEFPKYPGRVPTAGIAGVVEVVIDQTGSVESASMQSGFMPGYDTLVMTATRGWRYQPARVNGSPVKFRKQISIKIVPDRTN